MGTNPSGEASLAVPRRHVLSKLRLLLTLGLLVLVVLCLAFSWVTRDAVVHLPFPNGEGTGQGRLPGPNTVVDLHAWKTAQALAPLAVTAEELHYARQAQRLADHEGDLAFSSALRQASNQNHALKGEALALSQKVAQLQQMVKADQAEVDSLTQTAKVSPSAENPAAPAISATDLDVAKAQLGRASDADSLTITIERKVH